jgi:hypothetical protein
MDALNTQVVKKLALTAALAYLLFLAVYMLPSNPVRDALLAPVLPAARFIGLEEKWNVYPSVATSNTRLHAYLTCADGSTTIVELWEPDRMEPWQRFRYQKVIKLFHMYGPSPADKLFWRDICKYVVRSHSFWQSNPPKTVTLVLRWSDIPPPSQFVAVSAVPRRVNSLTLCTYEVQPEDVPL